MSSTFGKGLRLMDKNLQLKKKKKKFTQYEGHHMQRSLARVFWQNSGKTEGEHLNQTTNSDMKT